MLEKNDGFERNRIPYFLAQILVGWPLCAVGFLVWCFNVLVLRKSAFGKFSGSLSLLECSPAIRGIRYGSAGWQSLHIIYNWYGHFGFPKSHVTSVEASTSALEETLHVNGFRPHILEMAGFLDYRPDEKAVALMARIRELLPPNGCFITCHIHPNLERHFLRWVLCWPMIYRRKADFLRLIEESGKWLVRDITEPQAIHTVAVCIKEP